MFSAREQETPGEKSLKLKIGKPAKGQVLSMHLTGAFIKMAPVMTGKRFLIGKELIVLI